MLSISRMDKKTVSASTFLGVTFVLHLFGLIAYAIPFHIRSNSMQAPTIHCVRLSLMTKNGEEKVEEEKGLALTAEAAADIETDEGGRLIRIFQQGRVLKTSTLLSGQNLCLMNVAVLHPRVTEILK